MSTLEKLVDLLGKMGFNTTRLKWKLFQMEKRREQQGYGMRLPASLQWLTYPHKHCKHCRALIERSARVCPNCGKRAPTLIGYRVARLIGLSAPQGAPIAIGAFCFVMLVHFAMTIAMQGMSALIAPTGVTITVFGAWSPLLGVLHHEWWRYFSFGLAHGNLMHIAFNLFALMQIGPLIEERIGPVRMLVLITATQLTAAIASHAYYYSYLTVYQSNPMALLTPTVGASGWLFGLIGFGILHFRGQIGALGNVRDQLVKWGIYSLIFGFVIGANNAAHVGGMLGGMALALIPEARRQAAPVADALWKSVAILCLGVWLVTFAYLTHSVLTKWAPGGERDAEAIEVSVLPKSE